MYIILNGVKYFAKNGSKKGVWESKGLSDKIIRCALKSEATFGN